MKNKKGIVIEMAIFFILMGSVICTLLLTNSLIMNSQNNLLITMNERTLELERLGDSFAAGGTPTSEMYAVDVDEDEDEDEDEIMMTVKMTVKFKDTGNVVLTVKRDGDGHITGWTYGQ